MRFFVIATRNQTASSDEFTTELLQFEGKRAPLLTASRLRPKRQCLPVSSL